MTEEILEPKEVTERWNLSDDDDYVDINIIEDEFIMKDRFYMQRT